MTSLQSSSRSERAQLSLWQISDLHFGPPFDPVVAEAALRSVEALEPDAIIVNGDLTQRAKRTQFQEARTYLERLPAVPRIVVPGNHDVPLYRVYERLYQPHQLYQEIISPELNPILTLASATIVGLDTSAPRTAITNGLIRPWQLERCVDAFENSPPEKIRIVVAHHPFASAPDWLPDKLMPHSERAIRTFSRYGVELICGGHLHRGYVSNTLDFYPDVSRDHGILISQCGTTTSRRGRGREQFRNSFNWIEIIDDAIKITHFLYQPITDQFESFAYHVYPRQRRSTLAGE